MEQARTYEIRYVRLHTKTSSHSMYRSAFPSCKANVTPAVLKDTIK